MNLTLPFAALCVAMMLGACTGSSQYRDEAEATCRERGLAPGSAEFKACADEAEEALYRRMWSRYRGVPSGG